MFLTLFVDSTLKTSFKGLFKALTLTHGRNK